MPGFPTTEPTESEQLLVFLAQQRRVLSHAAYGLTDEQARLSPSTTLSRCLAMSLGSRPTPSPGHFAGSCCT